MKVALQFVNQLKICRIRQRGPARSYHQRRGGGWRAGTAKEVVEAVYDLRRFTHEGNCSLQPAHAGAGEAGVEQRCCRAGVTPLDEVHQGASVIQHPRVPPELLQQFPVSRNLLGPKGRKIAERLVFQFIHAVDHCAPG